MSARILAVDGGTTNTRLTLVEGTRATARLKIKVGVRDTVLTGSNRKLREAVRDGMTALLDGQGLTFADLSAVAASGMITSENGLFDLAHITSPAGADELARGAAAVELPDVCPLPIRFIPGVKTFSDPFAHDLSELDVMRGEEAELVGLTALCGVKPPFCAIMPGSHMKIAELDEKGRIASFRTSITGELSRAAAENTILAQSLGGVFPKTFDLACLRAGRDYAAAHGLGEALFKVRVQANFLKNASAEQLYAFLCGAVMRDDVTSIAATPSKTILIAGSDPFRSGYAALLEDAGKTPIVVSDETAEDAAAVGAAIIISRCL